MIYEELTVAHLREWGRDVDDVSDRFLGRQVRQSLGYGVRDRDGSLIAIGGVRWRDGRCWAWFDMRRDRRSRWVHRVARELLSALGAAGEREVWATADDSVPGSAVWLKRLGFQPCGGVWRLGLGGISIELGIDAAAERRPGHAS